MPHFHLPLARRQLSEAVTFVVVGFILWNLFPHALLVAMIAADNVCQLTVGRFVDTNYPLYERVLVVGAVTIFLCGLCLLGQSVRKIVRTLFGDRYFRDVNCL